MPEIRLTFRSLLMRIALPYLMWGRSTINVLLGIFSALLDVILCESLGDTNTDSTLSCTSLIAWIPPKTTAYRRWNCQVIRPANYCHIIPSNRFLDGFSDPSQFAAAKLTHLKAEINYYRGQFDLHKTDLKKSWNIIKIIISKEDNRHSEKHTCFLINNQYISDSKIIANTFNNYFVYVGSSLAKNIQTETNPLQYFESIENNIHIPEINMDEVRTIISAIKNSASGYDELPASILNSVQIHT